MTGTHVTVLAADFELSASNSVDALRAGAAAAVAEAAAGAGAGLMEPVMAVAISAEERFVGPILTDITAHRRGVVASVADGDASLKNARRTIHATVPLAELVAYATVLRSLTQGGGDFTMALAAYEFAP
jgi:elongation factor G